MAWIAQPSIIKISMDLPDIVRDRLAEALRFTNITSMPTVLPAKYLSQVSKIFRIANTTQVGVLTKDGWLFISEMPKVFVVNTPAWRNGFVCDLIRLSGILQPDLVLEIDAAASKSAKKSKLLDSIEDFVALANDLNMTLTPEQHKKLEDLGESEFDEKPARKTRKK